MKTVSRFEYAIDQFINDNIEPRDMSKIKRKTQTEEDTDRRAHLEQKFRNLVIRIKSK